MRTKIQLSLYVFILMLSINPNCIFGQSNQDDYTALRAIYLSTDGDNWERRSGWPSRSFFEAHPILPDFVSMNGWQGLVFSGGRLTRMTLLGESISGPIPPEIELLTSLEYMYISGSLSGEIPPQIGSLRNLISLNLSGNNLIGNIPLNLGSLVLLENLSLNGNSLTGLIPSSLGALRGLKYLSLFSNQLAGAIPPQLGNLINLLSLTLNNNRLSGPIPPELEGMQRLTNLSLANNLLSGEIPAELGNMSTLTSLSLSGNRLTGEIPSALGQLRNLTLLYLFQNQLSGSIPSELGNLSNLNSLFLRNNQLSGEIPPELGNLANLRTMTLRNNQLSGEIPNSFSQLSNLQVLYLASNQLSGKIPAFLGQLTQLTSINLRFNQFSGEIPSELGDLPDLRILWLQANQLTGQIPASFHQLDKLIRFSVDFNDLSGCYDPLLKEVGSVLCSFTNANVSNGNNFDATWEEFCATDLGACETCPPTLVEISVSNPICEGEEFQLFAHSEDISLQYFWSGPNNFNSTQQNPSVSEALLPGIYQYHLEVLSTNAGCEEDAYIEVKVLENPSCVINISEEDDCIGNSITLVASATGGTLAADENYSFQWYKDGKMLKNEVSSEFKIEAEGTYEVDVFDAYCKSSCSYTIGKECGTAWAYLENKSNCINDYCQSNNWGFTTLLSSGEYTFDLIQGGPNMCNGNGSSGIKVGEVSISYDGVNNPTLSFNTSEQGYFIEEVHIYSGYQPVLEKRNKCRMAPGLFQDTYKLDKEETFSVELTNTELSGGEIWVAIHVESCRFTCEEDYGTSNLQFIKPVKEEFSKVTISNPAYDGKVLIDLPTDLMHQNLNIYVVSAASGQLVQHNKIYSTNRKINLSVEGLKSGVYILSVDNDLTDSSHKLIVLN